MWYVDLLYPMENMECCYLFMPSTCAQTLSQLEIRIINVILGIIYFREIISKSSQDVNETTLFIL